MCPLPLDIFAPTAILTLMEISVILAVFGILATVVTNLVMWVTKFAKIEEKVEQTDKPVDALAHELKEVRQENREEIKAVRTEIKEVNVRIDTMSKEISFIRGTIETFLKNVAQGPAPVDKPDGFVIKEE